MLASREAAVRVRAFDLVLNLCVHAHLLEPMQSEDQASVEESSQPSPLTGGSFSSVLSAGDFPVGERERTFQENGRGKGLSEKPERGTQAAVAVFEAWLLDIVCEMLLYLVQVHLWKPYLPKGFVNSNIVCKYTKIYKLLESHNIFRKI